MTTHYHQLSVANFRQDWSDKSQISANDDWSRVVSIVGYLGDYSSASPTGVDPRTLVSATGGTTIDVIANQTNPSQANASGGVAEFDLANPTIALNGSGTADAPNIVIHLDASGRQNVAVSFLVRDLDASADDAAQQVAVQYRTSPTAAWKNVPGGYVADATDPNSATRETPVSVVLPADANNVATLQVRILTTNAGGNDEWVGIDDIVVASDPAAVDLPGILSIADASVVEGDAAPAELIFSVERTGGSSGAVSATYTIDFVTASAADLVGGTPLIGTVQFADGQTRATITIAAAGDLRFEATETFTVTLSAPTGGAALGDAQAIGSIIDNEARPPVGGVFINEIHYDDAGTDAGEGIEIAAPAGTNLSGWSLVFYNGGDNGTNAGAATVASTRALSGIVGDQDDGFGTTSVAVVIQNGPNDGVALVDPSGRVVQFLSWEGPITAAAGAAAGMTSTDIGVAENGEPDGLSLQLVGAGASYDDFAWAAPRDQSFGAVNSGQDFIGGNATGQIRVGDVRVAEGDDGVQQLVFTVRRAGGLAQEASVDWALSLGSGAGQAGLSDLAAGQALAGSLEFAVGVASIEVRIGIAGDTLGEASETLRLLLQNPTGNVVIVDGEAVGTIVNDDPVALRIYEIQGEGHRSAYDGQPVITTGIVTGVTGNGFYLQDAAGDGNHRTSDALFVFTGAAPSVRAGDAVEVTGRVAENLPGGDPTNLSTTQVAASAVTVRSTGNDLPAAVVIGEGGRTPPTETIDDDSFTSFDPASDGIDFYESLEGMRVTIDAPLVVAPTTSFGETFVVASGGRGATGVNERGGITISDGDYNPEKIQIDDSALFPGYQPNHAQGDILGDVTGILSYSFNSYEVLVTEAVTTTSVRGLEGETTALAGGRDHLTIASYNVENLSPTDSQAKFDLLADNIVYSLAAPDIIALQEVQDADGAGRGSDLSGAATAQKLIDAIAGAGGPDYVYVEIAPTVPNSTGGEGNGNIRNGYLYRADRVSYVEGSALLLQDPAFDGSRKPLVADFRFNGETVRLINVHFTSRGGSDPLWGSTQPPADAGDGARAAQGAAVDAYVTSLLGNDASLKLGVLGDFNGFWFEDNVTQLEGGVLTNLHRLLPEEERYSYMFDGNLQALDNFLVSGGLYAGAAFDAVHINAEFPEGPRATDHDPTVARFFIEHPNEAPVDLVLDGNAVAENAAAGTLVGTVRAGDPDPEDVPLLRYTLVDDADGLFALDAATGRLTTTSALDHEAQASHQLVIRATDPDGLSVERTVTVTVGDVNEAPVAAADRVAVNEDGTTANLWSLLLGNDSDPDAGATLAIASVDGSGTLGSLVFDPATQTLRYVADHDSFDALAPGATVVDSFRYTVTDQNGLSSTAIVSVTVTGLADGIRRDGGNGSDWLNGGGGEDDLSGGNGIDLLYGEGGHDELYGENGNDALFGGDGHDWLDGGTGEDALFGGDGNDVLIGGKGSDALTGGDGRDLFVLGKSGGSDVILDFDTAEDRLVLEGGIRISSSRAFDLDRDGDLDLTIAFSNGGGSVTLLGVGSLAEVGFAPAAILGDHPAI